MGPLPHDIGEAAELEGLGTRRRAGLSTRRQAGLSTRRQAGLSTRRLAGQGWALVGGQGWALVGEGWKRCWCYRRRTGTDNAPGFELPIYCTPQCPRPSQPLGPREATNYGHRASCLTKY